MLEANEAGAQEIVFDFICSEEGRSFLKAGHAGMRRLRFFFLFFLRNELYGKAHFKYLLFMLCSFVCCGWAFFGATTAVLNHVGFSFTLWQYLERVLVILGKTFTPLLAFIGFCGNIPPANLHLRSVPPLTYEEKLMISLVLARSVHRVFEEPKFFGQRPVTEDDDRFFAAIPDLLRAGNQKV